MLQTLQTWLRQHHTINSILSPTMWQKYKFIFIIEREREKKNKIQIENFDSKSLMRCILLYTHSEPVMSIYQLVVSGVSFSQFFFSFIFIHFIHFPLKKKQIIELFSGRREQHIVNCFSVIAQTRSWTVKFLFVEYQYCNTIY